VNAVSSQRASLQCPRTWTAVRRSVPPESCDEGQTDANDSATRRHCARLSEPRGIAFVNLLCGAGRGTTLTHLRALTTQRPLLRPTSTVLSHKTRGRLRSGIRTPGLTALLHLWRRRIVVFKSRAGREGFARANQHINLFDNALRSVFFPHARPAALALSRFADLPLSSSETYIQARAAGVASRGSSPALLFEYACVPPLDGIWRLSNNQSPTHAAYKICRCFFSRRSRGRSRASRFVS